MNSSIDSLDHDFVFLSLSLLQSTYLNDENYDIERIKQFRESGGLTHLLRFIERPNLIWVGKVINILSYCCIEPESCNIIANTKTVTKLMGILKSTFDDKIVIDICTILSKLAENTETDVAENIIRFLLLNERQFSQEIISTACDCLHNSKQDVVETLSTLFNPNNNNSSKIIIILSDLTCYEWTENCVQEVKRNIGIANLINYVQNGDDKIQEASLYILTQIATENEEICEEIIKSGIIPIYINMIHNHLEDDVWCRRLVDNLGVYCNNLNDRIQFCENGGLETLILLLNRSHDLDTVSFVIELIFFFITDESNLKKLLNLNLIQILVRILALFLPENQHEVTEEFDSSTDLNVSQMLVIFEIALVSEKNYTSCLTNVTVLETLLQIIVNRLDTKTSEIAEGIFINLIENPYCLERLVTLKVLDIFNKTVLLHSVNECCICRNVQYYQIFDRFKKQIRSDIGLGIINRLLTGNQLEKESSAIMLPYLFSSSARQQYPQVYDKATDSLLQIMADPKNENFEMSLLSFIEIIKLQLKFTENSVAEECKFNCCVYDVCCKDVCFILDDGQRVSANRQKISETSDMFKAMLFGCFIEANQSEIVFRYASKVIFKFIMHFLHGCKTSGGHVCPVVSDSTSDFLFEVAKMADRILAINVKNNLLNIILSRLTVGTIIITLRCAEMNNVTSAFLSLLIDYMLESNFPHDRMLFFTEILKSEFNELLLIEIKKRLREFCMNN